METISLNHGHIDCYWNYILPTCFNLLDNLKVVINLTMNKYICITIRILE